MEGRPNCRNKEIKLRFHDGLVWRVGLTIEIKLGFRDGLVWTVDLTVEIKLCFQISPAQCGPKLSLISLLCSCPFSNFTFWLLLITLFGFLDFFSILFRFAQPNRKHFYYK